MRVSDDLVRILVEGKYRAKLTELEDRRQLPAGHRCARPRCAPWRRPRKLPEAEALRPQRQKEL